MTLDVSQVCDEATHAAIKADPVRWAQCTPCRRQFIELDFGDGEVEVHEYRNCACKSTLTKVVRS